MSKFNDTLMQTVLDQSPSIDAAAHTMCESNYDRDFYYWRNRMLKKIENGELTTENMK